MMCREIMQSGSAEEKSPDKSLPISGDAVNSERDINDVFDDIALSEERIKGEAYDEGFCAGELEGSVDGYHLGFHRGTDIGRELGYYNGILTGHNKTNQTTHSERTVTAVETCLRLIDNYPRTNDEHVDIFEELEKIRSQYRKACALLKISSKYPEANKLSF